MSREKLLYLVGGLIWGVVIGITLPYAMDHRPGHQVGAGPTPPPAAPQGPMAPTQVGGAGSGSAPMMAEIGRLKDRLAEAPEDYRALVRLANLYHDVGMWPQAVEYYERAVAVDDSDPNVVTDLGTSLQQVDRLDEALEMFARAHETDPTHWQSLFNTVVVAGLRLGRIDEAHAALAELERVHPQAPRLGELKAELERLRVARGSPP